MYKLINGFLFFGWFLICCTDLYAGSENTIVIGADHNPPFRILEDGTYSGIYGELINEIVKGMNLRVKFRKAPFKRCLHELKTGKQDVFLALFRRSEREVYLYYCEPYIKKRTDKAFYLLKGDGTRIQGYSDLYGLMIGKMRGTKIAPGFDSDTALTIVPVNNHEQNFIRLAAGRIDAFVHTEIASDYQIKKLGYNHQFEKAPFKINQEQATYFVVSRKSKYIQRVAEFEENLRRIYEKRLFWELVGTWTN